MITIKNAYQVHTNRWENVILFSFFRDWFSFLNFSFSDRICRVDSCSGSSYCISQPIDFLTTRTVTSPGILGIRLKSSTNIFKMIIELLIIPKNVPQK